jgi:hypothetical protein
VSRRSASSRLATWIVSLSIIGAVHLAGADTASPQQRSDVGTGEMSIVEHGSSVGPGGSVHVALQLPGVIAPGDQLTLSIHDPVANEDEFFASAFGEELGGVLHAADWRVSELAPDQFGVVDLVVQLSTGSTSETDEDEGVRLARPGVYPTSIELRTAEQELVGRIDTHLVRLPDPAEEEAPTGALPVVVLLAVPEMDDPGSAIDWIGLLGRHPDVAVTASITPELIDHAAGTPELAAITELGTMRELIRRPYFPVDEAALAAARLDDEVAALLERGDEIIAAVANPAPATLWFGHEDMGVELATALYERGVRDAVVAPSALASTLRTPPRRPVELISGDVRLRSLVLDELVPAQEGDSPVATAQRMAAQLATIALTGEEGQIIALDVSTDNDIALTEAILRQLAGLPLVRTVLASEAIGEPLAVGADRLPVREPLVRQPTDELVITDYLAAESQLAAYRSMIRDEDAADHDLLAAELQRSLSSNVEQSVREAAWQQVIDYVRRQTSLVDAPPEESINLTSRRASVPFSFQNRSDLALRVEVRFISDKLRVEDLDDGESTTLLLEPGVTTREFQLQALSTGSFPLTIELHSPDGTLLVSRSRSAVRSTTPTGVGLALTLGAAVFLLAWWVLDLRRRRRA